MDNDGFDELPAGAPIPDDLPEPIKELIRKAQAAGGTVRMTPLTDHGGIKSAVLHLSKRGNADLAEGEHTKGHGADCKCHWCDLNRDLHAVNDTTELNWLQKYEAADALMNKAIDAAREREDVAVLFSLRMHQLSFSTNLSNRKFFCEGAETRIRSCLEAAHELLGLPKYEGPVDNASIDRAMAKVIVMALHNGAEGMVQVSAVGMLIHDCQDLRANVFHDAMEFHVKDVTDPVQLAKLF